MEYIQLFKELLQHFHHVLASIFKQVYSKKNCPILHEKEALVCWLQKFVPSCALIDDELHQKIVKVSTKAPKYGATQDEILQPANQSFFLVQHRAKFFRVYSYNFFQMLSLFSKSYYLIPHCVLKDFKKMERGKFSII